MKIRPQVLPWLAGILLPAIGFYARWLVYNHLLFLTGFIIFSVLSVFLLYFFRDPSRQPESEAEDSWLAPADGVVKSVDNLEDGRHKIVIFLSIFNVHINRMPVSGEIEEIDYNSGDFRPAFAKDIENRNERNIVRCRDAEDRSFELWQIAGVLARRIYFWLDKSNLFDRGQRCGMIALSSRTDLIMPAEVEPMVQTGETVRAGKTEIARG